MNDISKLPKWAQDELNLLRSGIKGLSDLEELCAETTGDDPFSVVYLAAKIDECKSDITQLSTLYSNAIARAEKAEEALRLVVAHDNLLLRYEGPSYTLFAGDVAEIDASYDKMVSAARAAVLAEGNK